jgi:hypothetical protein
MNGGLRQFLLAVLVVLGAVAAFSSNGQAHEIRPAYLQIDQTSANRFNVLWRTPLFSGKRLPVALRFPDDVRDVTEPSEQVFADSIVERRVIEAPDGLTGKRIDIVGLQATITDALVRIGMQDGTQSTTLVRPSRPWVEVPEAQGWLDVVAIYLQQGIEHILFGIDHLLFVAALMLVVRDWRMLVKIVTAFTVAHSITLSLATFGVVTPAAAPVEAMIALSIVLAASEAIRLQRGGTSLTTQWPWIVAFAFGLLHGFGFAGALKDLGLPSDDTPLALLSFNVGVEIGQLIFIGALLAVVHALHTIFAMPRRAPIAAAYAIGAVAAFWSVERIVTILSPGGF